MLPWKMLPRVENVAVREAVALKATLCRQGERPSNLVPGGLRPSELLLHFLAASLAAFLSAVASDAGVKFLFEVARKKPN